jgi:predicted site-specific integrase-resolvase
MNQTNPSPVTLLKKKPLALLLGVSSRTIDAWVAQRVIPYIAASPRMHLFEPEAVKQALKAKFGVDAIMPRSQW